MDDRERRRPEAGHRDLLVGLQVVQPDLGPGGAGVGLLRGIEDVGEPVPQHGGAVGRRVGGHAAAQVRGEHPQVVDAVDVFGVAMGDPDAVDAAHARREELEAQLRGRVHQEHAGTVVAGEQGTAPAALVAGVGRCAGGAVAADDRDTEGSAGAQEPQSHTTSTRIMLVVPATWKGTPAVTTIRCPGSARACSSRNERAQDSMSS